MMNLRLFLYTGAKSSLSHPTPIVLLLADGCKLIGRDALVPLVSFFLRGRSYRTMYTCTKTTEVDMVAILASDIRILLSREHTIFVMHATWRLSRHIQYSIEPLWKLLFEILASKHLSIYMERSTLYKKQIISIDHMHGLSLYITVFISSDYITLLPSEWADQSNPVLSIWHIASLPWLPYIALNYMA